MVRFLKRVSLASLLSLSAFLSADLPQPYTSITLLPVTYSYVPDSYVLYSLATNNSSAVVIDVGSEEGSVARYLAQQNIPSITQIYSVSLWPNGDPPQYNRYQEFLSNVIQDNSAEKIVPLRMSSEEAATALNVSADLIYIGSNDSFTLYEEISHWVGNLSDTGYLCGNNWNLNAAKVAVANAANDFNLNLGISGVVWYLSKN